MNNKTNRGYSQRLAKYCRQCTGTGQKIEQKNITKLNSYARDTDNCIERSNKNKYRLKPGTQLIKKYKGKQIVVDVISTNKFAFNGNVYDTLSAISSELTGYKNSGYDFFGFGK
jgi:hypothetical protein